MFRKILKYDPTFGDRLSKYDGYTRITTQVADPDIQIQQDDSLDALPNLNPIIFTSSLKRGMQTARVSFPNITASALTELNEIKFDLTKLVSKEEYLDKGSTLVRTKFIESFIEDSLLERRVDIKARMDTIIKMLTTIKHGDCLIISHSFFMKLFQIYISHHDLFDNPNILRTYFDSNIKTFEFGKGFDCLVTTDGTIKTIEQ